MPEFTFADERSFFYKIRETGGRGSGRCTGYRRVFSGAHAALESFRAFRKHPQERFLLPLVNLRSKTVK